MRVPSTSNVIRVVKAEHVVASETTMSSKQLDLISRFCALFVPFGGCCCMSSDQNYRYLTIITLLLPLILIISQKVSSPPSTF